MPSLASIVIPAHNEATVLPKLLAELTSATSRSDALDLDIIVACNGCTDDTAALARSFVDVTVLELPIGSKIAALNAGDEIATSFPRVYLDADIDITRSALLQVIQAISDGALAAAPQPQVDTSGCSAFIAGYFTVWSRLGYSSRHTLGSGVYALSEAGRSRFGQFPDLIADDGFVYCQFSESERINPAGASFSISPPRTLRALVARRVRIVAGNIELQQKLGLRIRPPAPGWKQVLRAEPGLLGPVTVYLAVNALAALAARRRAGQGTAGAWGQDRTSRQPAAARMLGDQSKPAPTKPAPTKLAPTKNGRLSMNTASIRAGARRLASARTWLQLVRVANFLGYDGLSMREVTLGSGVRVGATVSVRNGSRISIGDGAHIGQGCLLWAGDQVGRISIGSHALLAPNVFITASNYDFDSGRGPVMDLPKREADVSIGANTWLGANVVVLAGVSIGEETIVAAGSVVTSDLPANCVAAGVPARVLRTRGEAKAPTQIDPPA